MKKIIRSIQNTLVSLLQPPSLGAGGLEFKSPRPDHSPRSDAIRKPHNAGFSAEAALGLVVAGCMQLFMRALEIPVSYSRFLPPSPLFRYCANRDSTYLCTMCTILTAYEPLVAAAFCVGRHREGESK
jgi:hypothetical protein